MPCSVTVTTLLSAPSPSRPTILVSPLARHVTSRSPSLCVLILCKFLPRSLIIARPFPILDASYRSFLCLDLLLFGTPDLGVPVHVVTSQRTDIHLTFRWHWFSGCTPGTPIDVTCCGTGCSPDVPCSNANCAIRCRGKACGSECAGNNCAQECGTNAYCTSPAGADAKLTAQSAESCDANTCGNECDGDTAGEMCGFHCAGVNW